MESKTPKPMTPFDVLTTPSHLYTLKLLLPYTPPSMQHFFAIYIKLQELTYTFQHFHGCKQEQMETVENIMNMMTLMQSMPDSAEPDLSDLFSSMFAQETGTEGKNMEGNKENKEGDADYERMDEPSTNERDRSTEAGTDQKGGCPDQWEDRQSSGTCDDDLDYQR